MSGRISGRMLWGLLWIQFGMALYVSAPSFANEPPVDEISMISDSLKSPLGAALRSVILPGWGQWYNNRKFKSAAAFAVEGSVLYFALQQKNEYDKYGDENARKKRNTLYWLGFFLHLISITDAYVDAHLYRFDDSMNISLESRENNCMISFRIDW